MDGCIDDRISSSTTESAHTHSTNRSGSTVLYDLDDPAILAKSLHEIRGGNISNFVVDFSDESAFVQFNLGAKAFSDILATDRVDKLSTRWINVWYPYHQRGTLEVLARRYDFSPRLLALMYSDPAQERRADASASSIDQSSRMIRL